jgi:hypothetical protein
VLQHIPTEFQKKYLSEFARVCAPGGIIVFNLPCRFTPPSRLTALKKRIIDHLPPPVRDLLRRWRRGASGLIEMHPMPRARVEALFEREGCRLVAAEDDHDAGEHYACFRYLFARTAIPDSRT